MKNTFCLLFSFISLLIFSQMGTFKFENAISYRMKNDFYSNYLTVFSTPDYSTNLFVVATPMGNFATLNINNHFYAVYSDDGKVFKIDIEETIDRNKYKSYTDQDQDNPDLDLTDYKNSISVKKTNKKETIKTKRCDVYSSNGENGTICVDTTSKLNTVPFLIPAIKDSVKGLIYRIGDKIKLNYSGAIENLGKDENSEEKVTKQEDFIIQFDEKSETENYKKEYNKRLLSK